MRKINGRCGAVAGVTALMGMILASASVTAQAQTYKILHRFRGGTDGSYSQAGLVWDGAGNLYGTTANGGETSCGDFFGCGTVFKLDRTGTETVLYSFVGGADAWQPYGSLVRDAAGNVYGTTALGGGGTLCGDSGCGTVFELSTAGAESVLHAFTGEPDGAGPYAGLVRDLAGNLYGTTEYGGASNAGAVFKVDSTGTETVLYRFNGAPDGAAPDAGLVRDAAGNLYGATVSGGDTSCSSPFGCGTVFKLDTTGKETVLHSFTGGEDGTRPSVGGLIRDAGGNLYGATVYGGDVSCDLGFGCGVVFGIRP